MTDRTLLILSDIEIGAGGLADDFPHDELVHEILEEYAAKFPRVELVLNGDTLDFLRTPIERGFPAHVTAAVACEKLDRIARAHGEFFAAIRTFLSRGDHRVHFVVGNHDAEILFPQVQRVLAGACGDPTRVNFPGFSTRFGPVHIEHGSQLDPMFAMAADRPFVGDPDDPILNLPWGTLALGSIWSLLKQDLFALDRIKPRERLFELLPDARTLMLKQSWKYWSHDFWKDFSRDPLKHVTWPMIKEVTYRFRSADAEVSIRERYEHALERSSARLFVIGHEHRPARISVGGKTLMVSGCMRNEYRLDPHTDILRPVEKSGIEVQLAGDHIALARMIRYPAPTAPAGYVPADVREMQPMIQHFLDQLKQTRPG